MLVMYMQTPALHTGLPDSFLMVRGSGYAYTMHHPILPWHHRNISLHSISWELSTWKARHFLDAQTHFHCHDIMSYMQHTFSRVHVHVQVHIFNLLNLLFNLVLNTDGHFLWPSKLLGLGSMLLYWIFMHAHGVHKSSFSSFCPKTSKSRKQDTHPTPFKLTRKHTLHVHVWLSLALSNEQEALSHMKHSHVHHSHSGSSRWAVT